VTNECEEGATVDGSNEHISLDNLANEIIKQQNEAAGDGKEFSDVEISFTVKTTTCPDLTVVDLPGMFENAGSGQNKDAPKQVEKMVKRYCRDKNTIMMCVSDANVDLENCKGLKVCRQIDREGERTIGVLTKCDKLEDGQEIKIL